MRIRAYFTRIALPLVVALLAVGLLAGCGAPADPVPTDPSGATPTAPPVPPAAAVPQVPDAEMTPPACTQTAPPGHEENAGGELPAGAVLFGAFTTEDLDGNAVSEAVFAENKLTMINIWGTFCGPCLREMPDLGELHAAYASRGFAIVGIVTDATDRSGAVVASQVRLAKEIIADTGANYLHLLPSDSLTEIKLQDVMYIPETVFVDSRGVVIGEPLIGSMNKGSWEKVIEERLAEVGA